MPTAIALGTTEAHEKLTARLFFQPAGSTGYADVGNVKEYSEVHERNTVTRVVAEKGFRRTNDEQVDVATASWEFTLDEFDLTTLALMHQGTAGTTSSQASTTAPSGTHSISTVVLGKWYSIGKVGLDTLVVKKDADPDVTLVSGTDYDADLDTGMIKFKGSTLAGGETILLTFGNDAVDFEVVTGLDVNGFRGDFILHEFNQHSTIPLKTTSGTCTLHATEFPTQSGEFGTWKIKLTATSKPTVKRRSVA